MRCPDPVTGPTTSGQFSGWFFNFGFGRLDEVEVVNRPLKMQPERKIEEGVSLLYNTK